MANVKVNKELLDQINRVKMANKLFAEAEKDVDKFNKSQAKKKKESKFRSIARKFFGGLAIAYVLSGVLGEVDKNTTPDIEKDFAKAGWVLEPEREPEPKQEPEPENLASVFDDEPLFEVDVPEPEPKKEPKPEKPKPKKDTAKKNTLLDIFDNEIEIASKSPDAFDRYFGLEDIEFDVDKALGLDAHADLDEKDREEVKKKVVKKVRNAQDQISQEERLDSLDLRNRIQLFEEEIPEFEVTLPFGMEEKPVFDEISDDEYQDVRKAEILNRYAGEIEKINTFDDVFEKYFALDDILHNINVELDHESNSGLDENVKKEIKAQIKADVHAAQERIDQQERNQAILDRSNQA